MLAKFTLLVAILAATTVAVPVPQTRAQAPNYPAGTIPLQAYQTAPQAYQAQPQAYRPAPQAYQVQPQAQPQAYQLGAGQALRARPLAGQVGAVKAGIPEYEDEIDPHPKYNFAFDVKDDEFTNYQNRKENRDGDTITGSYSVVDADGFVRTVKYTADPVGGFKAEVSREPSDIVIKFPTPQPAQQAIEPTLLRSGPSYKALAGGGAAIPLQRAPAQAHTQAHTQAHAPEARYQQQAQLGGVKYVSSPLSGAQPASIRYVSQGGALGAAPVSGVKYATAPGGGAIFYNAQQPGLNALHLAGARQQAAAQQQQQQQHHQPQQAYQAF